MTDVESRLEQAGIASENAGQRIVAVGAHVRVRDSDGRLAEEYDIAGSGEGDPAHGRISLESPMASALLGHHEGELVEVETPVGTRRVEILEVR